MKSGNLLLGLVTCAAMCACTDNDIANSGGTNGSQIFDGDKLYMVVNISEVGSAATKATSNGFSTGSENAVNDIYFYFYTSDGTYETYTNATTTWKNGDDGDNVELSGNKVVALPGLANKEFPAYMVTVINKPDGFNPPSTLEGMGEALASTSGTGIKKTISSTDYYTMSTSSYFDDSAETDTDSDDDTESCDVHYNTYYYATPVSSKNFTTEPIEYDDADEETPVIPSTLYPVEIQVERLAVKVYLQSEIPYTVTFGASEGEELDVVTMEFSLIGCDDGSTVNTYPVWTRTDNGIEEVDYYLFYHLIGWDLSGTERQSYMMKHLDSSWMESTPWTGWSGNWNEATNYRSYWGQSVHYGVGTSSTNYPTTSSEVNPSNDYLDYLCADDIQDGRTANGYYSISDMGYRYCAENTNTAGSNGVIKSKYSSAITSAIVKAKLYLGYKPNKEYITDNIVSIDNGFGNEQLYREDAYLYHALDLVNGVTPIYIKNADGTYSTIDEDYVQLTKAGDDGLVKVSIISADEDNNAYTFYKDDQGADTYTATEVQGLIDDEFNNIYGSDANEYKEGYMYYYIPIEHLNNPGEEVTDIEEAQYGVVRNHYYNITIKAIDKLGRGIADTTEPIIPSEELEKYYIGAEIKILSWKEVDQEISF